MKLKTTPEERTRYRREHEIQLKEVRRQDCAVAIAHTEQELIILDDLETLIDFCRNWGIKFDEMEISSSPPVKTCEEELTLDGWHFKECGKRATHEIKWLNGVWTPRCGLHNGKRRKHGRPQIREIYEEKDAYQVSSADGR